jgi:hypothetical protein
MIDLSYNDFDCYAINYIILQLFNYKDTNIEYINLSGNNMASNSAKNLAVLIRKNKLKMLNTLIIHDCPKISTADL